MEIFEHGGLSCQTIGPCFSVWCYGGGRLIEVAHFTDLEDAVVYVDAIVEKREWFREVYTIVQL